MVRRLFPIVLCLLGCGCSQLDIKGFVMPTGDGVQLRFEQSVAMNEGLKAATVEADENYLFYVAADPHIYHTQNNVGLFNDAFRNDGDASFGVILGDCTDVRNNLPNYLRALEFDPQRHTYDHRIFHLLGNHDVYFNGWVDFKRLIGPSVYWFEVAFPGGKDLFICLDTATGTLGRDQTEWFRSFLASNRSNYRHCFILTHMNLFYTDGSQRTSGNMPIEETFALVDFLGRQRVTLVLQGHDHHREELSYGGVEYRVLGAIADKADNPEYLKVNVSPQGVELEWQYITQ